MKAIDYANQASNIFVLSDSFIRIKELIDSDNATIDDIAEVILLDPALSGTILKLANSAFYNYPGKIDTITKAVLVLGMTEVYNLVISYFTTSAFTSLDVGNEYLDGFWERSVDCALLMKFIGKHLRMKHPERLFIVGLLHNLGELVVKQLLPDKFEESNKVDKSINFVQQQQDTLGFTFAECTTELLSLWCLPETIIEPIKHQDSADVFVLSKESQLLFIAKRLMLQNALHNDAELTPELLPADVSHQLNITDEVVEHAKEYCDLERFSILSILNPNALMLY